MPDNNQSKIFDGMKAPPGDVEHQPSLRARTRIYLGSLFLATGAALLVYIISGISLLAAVCIVVVVATMLGAVLWVRLHPSKRFTARRLLGVGVVSGVLATLAYDGSRFALIAVTGIAFWPFDIFTIFGQALVGAGYTGWWVEWAGFGYHLANGVGFAVAYTLVWGRRGIWAGIAWALMLEVMMVSVYPGWLDLKALDEFIQVSIFGHLVYGTVLGYTARWLLTRKP